MFLFLESATAGKIRRVVGAAAAFVLRHQRIVTQRSRRTADAQLFGERHYDRQQVEIRSRRSHPGSSPAGPAPTIPTCVLMYGTRGRGGDGAKVQSDGARVQSDGVTVQREGSAGAGTFVPSPPRTAPSHPAPSPRRDRMFLFFLFRLETAGDPFDLMADSQLARTHDLRR